jgi:hypothetical protein
MKRLIALIAVLFVLKAGEADAAANKKVRVARCCSFTAPSWLVRTGAGEYRGRGGEVSVLHVDFRDMYAMVESLHGGELWAEETYTAGDPGDGWFVSSGYTSEGDVYYWRAEDGSCGTAALIVIHPRSSRKSFTPAISSMSKSFSVNC